MKFDDDFYARYSHGSSRFGDAGDAKALSKGKSPIGVFENITLRRLSGQPVLHCGGAGSDKFTRQGIYHLTHPSTESFFILDVGGQYMSTTFHWNLAQKREAYAINPHGVSVYPDMNHPVHLWSILKNDGKLFDRCRAVAAMAIIESAPASENAWVDKGARRWMVRFLTSHVRLEGCVKPNRLWQFINAINTDDDFLKSWGRACQGLPNDEYETFVEIYQKKKSSEKEYGAIMGAIRDDLDWLSSKQVADSVSGDADYLPFLGDPKKKVGIYYAIEGGTTEENKSLTRMVVGIAQLHCVIANKGALPLFYHEEAASCGGADFIKKAASQYRKYFDSVFVYQSHGQITHLFGKDGAQEIIDSCGMQIYPGGGIRDPDSAKRLADAVGKRTIYVDNPMAQQDRAFRAESASWNAYWQDMDLFEAARTYEHEDMQSRTQRQAPRYVIDPAEVMKLTNEVLILTPGLGLPPILSDKLPPYWENPMMAGRYAPDPLFPPLDRVKVKRKYFWGSKTCKFIRKAVPEHLADWPNHSNGEIAYVEGFKTF